VPDDRGDTDALRAALASAIDAVAARREGLQREFDEIVESASLTNTDDEHDPDGSTLAYERARTAALLTQAGNDLAYLHEARARLEDGAYGWCESCGAPIGTERLVARPTARDCIGCARR
jgi:DnaK suppressor protein